MFCPSCGAESALELNYCNRCGANMALAPTQEIVPISLTKPALVIGATTVMLTLGGFIILLVGAFNLAQVFKDADPLMACLVLGMLTIMVSDFMLIRLLSRIIRTSLETKRGVLLPRAAAKETPRQLSPRLEPVPSVTEHTTRTFSTLREPADRGPQ